MHYVDAKDVDLRRTGEYVEYRNDKAGAINFLLDEANEDALSITRGDWVWNDGHRAHWEAANAKLAAQIVVAVLTVLRELNTTCTRFPVPGFQAVPVPTK